MTGRREPGRIHPQVPDGWLTRESWTLLRPDGQGNVIVSVEPLAADVDLATYVGRQGLLLSTDMPGFTELLVTEIMTPQGLLPLRAFEWKPPDGVPVRQLQMYWVEPGAGYCATATCPATLGDRHDEDFFAVLSEVRLGQQQG